MGNYRELLAWQKARVLAWVVYRATEVFPARERYGLASQMRRAAVSAVSNIAEGVGRGSDSELRRFLMIARGSVSELETQIVIAADLHLLPESSALELGAAASETARLIHGLLRRYQRAKPRSSPQPSDD